MTRFLTVVSLVAAAAKAAFASQCIAMDSTFNLLAFNFNGKDYNAGTQDTWTGSGSAKDITASGRPPFTGTNTTCYLSQFYNAVYVLGSDASNPSSVYIYDVATTSWTTQSVTAGKFDATSYNAILDHDTNVFYALSKGEVFFLDMGALVTANSSAISWTDVEASPYGASYSPVMALAQNHIHFLDVPNVAAGSADIFVIHFSFFQPTPQPYPVNGGGDIPAIWGRTASLFQPSDVQQEFAFFPEDGSATYVINVETNTTQKLAGPTKDAQATYFAGITSLVQLTSSGAVSFLPYNEADQTANAAATWAPVANLASVAPSSSSGTGGSGNSTSGSGKGSGTASGSPSSTSSPKNDAVASKQATLKVISAMFALGAAAVLLF